MQAEQSYFTEKEAATFLRCSVKKLQTLRRDGQIAFFCEYDHGSSGGQRGIRYARQDLFDYMSSKRVEVKPRIKRKNVNSHKPLRVTPGSFMREHFLGEAARQNEHQA